MATKAKVADLLKPIGEVQTQAYFGRHIHTLGLIKWILSQTGSAEVWVSSYSTSEEFLRGFRLMRQSDSIRSAKMLLDVKASKKTVQLWRMMQACFDEVYLGENHSKVISSEPPIAWCRSSPHKTRPMVAVMNRPSSLQSHKSSMICSMVTWSTVLTKV